MKPEGELIGLKVVESTKQRAKTRLRPKVELMELKAVDTVESMK